MICDHCRAAGSKGFWASRYDVSCRARAKRWWASMHDVHCRARAKDLSELSCCLSERFWKITLQSFWALMIQLQVVEAQPTWLETRSKTMWWSCCAILPMMLVTWSVGSMLRHTSDGAWSSINRFSGVSWKLIGAPFASSNWNAMDGNEGFVMPVRS